MEKNFKGFVCLSRHTPNLANAEDVALNKGEVVVWKSKTGQDFKVTLVSELRQHTSGPYGYEVTFPDGSLAFVSERQITAWEGKKT